MTTSVGDTVAKVAGARVSIAEVDARETRLRASRLANSLPRQGTSEGRQLRRWLTQLVVTDRVVDAEARTLGVTADVAPSEADLLPDMSARLEIGSVAASALESPIGRALFVHITAAAAVGDAEVAEFHARNPFRFASRVPGPDGWSGRVDPSLADVRPAIIEHLLAAARRRRFRIWLDARRADLVELSPGYEHPGDPRQPDNTHRH
jgi:[acyl-carrier-protein] S-malonyltransferase